MRNIRILVEWMYFGECTCRARELKIEDKATFDNKIIYKISIYVENRKVGHRPFRPLSSLANSLERVNFDARPILRGLL